MFGLEIATAFDMDERKIGRRKAGVPIEDISLLRRLTRRGIHLGIIAVPETASQEVAEAPVNAVVQGTVSPGPHYPVVSQGVKRIEVDPARLPRYVPAGRAAWV